MDRLDCNPVEKKAELSLSWTSPKGGYKGFRIKVLNNNWNTTLEGGKNQTIVENLSYFTTYTIEIVTLSCEKMSVPQEKKCRTSITGKHITKACMYLLNE